MHEINIIWFAYLLLFIITFWPVEANLVNHDIMIQAKDLLANREIRNDPVLSLVEALTMEDEVVDVDAVYHSASGLVRREVDQQMSCYVGVH